MVIAMSVMVCNPVMAQTRKEKKAAKKAEWEFIQKKKELERQRALDSLENVYARPAKPPLGNSVDVPCYDQSRSDKEFLRKLGTGKSADLAFARRLAVQNAQSMMLDGLFHSVKSLVTNYCKDIADVDQIIENELSNTISELLYDADNTCETYTYDYTGHYNAFYAIEISKDKLVNKIADVLSKIEKLQTEFDRDKFRKYAEEYMQKQQDSKNEQQ